MESFFVHGKRAEDEGKAKGRDRKKRTRRGDREVSGTLYDVREGEMIARTVCQGLERL